MIPPRIPTPCNPSSQPKPFCGERLTARRLLYADCGPAQSVNGRARTHYFNRVRSRVRVFGGRQHIEVTARAGKAAVRIIAGSAGCIRHSRHASLLWLGILVADSTALEVELSIQAQDGQKEPNQPATPIFGVRHDLIRISNLEGEGPACRPQAGAERRCALSPDLLVRSSKGACLPESMPSQAIDLGLGPLPMRRLPPRSFHPFGFQVHEGNSNYWVLGGTTQ